MFLIYKQYLECWLLKRGGFRFKLFRFSSLLSDFRLSSLSTTQQNAWFNLRWVFPMNDVTSAQRWFPRAGARPSLSRQQSRDGPEVIAPAVTVKKEISHRLEVRLIYWEYLHLPLITWCHSWLNYPSSNACSTFLHCPKYNFMSWFSCVLLSDINNS